MPGNQAFDKGKIADNPGLYFLVRTWDTDIYYIDIDIIDI